MAVKSIKQNEPKVTVETYENSSAFGAYLLKQLVEYCGLTTLKGSELLDKFFNSSDSQKINVLSDLGCYYIQQLINGNVNCEEDLYQLLSLIFF